MPGFGGWFEDEGLLEALFCRDRSQERSKFEVVGMRGPEDMVPGVLGFRIGVRKVFVLKLSRSRIIVKSRALGAWFEASWPSRLRGSRFGLGVWAVVVMFSPFRCTVYMGVSENRGP